MIKTLKPFLLLVFLIASLNSQEVRTDNLLNLITNIKTAMPGNGSNGYVAPTVAQQDTFAILIDYILIQDYYSADSVAELMNYSLYEWYDTGSNNHLYYVLMENNADQTNGVLYGWGTYIFDPTGHSEVIIEVPHPRWDTNTWLVGFKGYQYLNTKYFLMAGTHRYANGSNPAPADVAHNTQNIFHVVHQKVSPLSTHSLQIHGFNSNNYTGYPDLVLSNGSSNPTGIVDSLANEISYHNYSVGIYDGINWKLLGATTNTQGQWSRGNGYSFIHMELDYFIRAAQSEWENILDAMYYVFLYPLTNIQEYQAGIPANYILGQNYPNPFNSTTNIEYFISKSQKAKLTIYNFQGKIVNTLVNKVQQAGQHKIKWNGKDNNNNLVASGLYIYHIESSGFKESKKLLLIK
jgi:hypothetical protein